MLGIDRRQFERFTLDLAVRFISRKDLESCGQLIDISEGGLALKTDAQAEIGDTVIAYPEGLGRITGVVRRKIEDGIAIEFDLSAAQRNHLKRRIESARTGIPYIRILENRNSKRITVNLTSKAREGREGKLFPCEIVDLSDTGALIKSKRLPNLGAEIFIGSIRGFVRRHTENGFALQFERSDVELAQCA